MPAPTLVIGAPCWIDLYSSDPAKATEFYGQLLGWKAEPPEEGFGGYFVFTKDGKVVAGCMQNSGEEGHPDAWTVYLLTDDASPFECELAGVIVRELIEEPDEEADEPFGQLPHYVQRSVGGQ